MAHYNGFPPVDMPLPDKPEAFTACALKLNEGVTDPRKRFLADKLVEHLHQFVHETKLTTEEWMDAIHFLTRVGQICTPLRQEFILLSDVLGISALVDVLNNPPMDNVTSSTVLGPFHTEDAPDVPLGGSIASEGKGEHLFVEGNVLSADGSPIPEALIETWETDGDGLYDNQYANRTGPDCRGKIRSDANGKYAFRAVVPVSYPVPDDGPVGDLLRGLNRHNMRPAHLHLMVEAPGHRTLITSLYPEADAWLNSDVVFGPKESLIVKFEDIVDEEQARARGIPGNRFKLLRFDIRLRKE